jgi:hypothetical protein
MPFDLAQNRPVEGHERNPLFHSFAKDFDGSGVLCSIDAYVTG